MVNTQWLGRLSYQWAWELQRLRRRGILSGHAPEIIWFLEHSPVITYGRRVPPEDLNMEQLMGRNIDFHQTERGGLATYHGPGQLVGYLMMDLHRHGLTVREFVQKMEMAIIAWLSEFGVLGERFCGRPGVWVGNEKICAIGIHVRRGVTMHGFALNLHTDLVGFENIVPCGYSEYGVTSLHLLIENAPRPQGASHSLGNIMTKTLFDTSACGG